MRMIGLALLLAIASPLCAAGSALDELETSPGYAAADLPAVPDVAQDVSGDIVEAEQYLPPDNDEPGFEWPGVNKGLGEDFIYMGRTPAFLRASPAAEDKLALSYGKCRLEPNTVYKVSARPGFTGRQVIVALAEPLPGCHFTRGYIYMTEVSSSSAGGLCELPRTVRAFMDTLAYSEGTGDRYDYLFGFTTFDSYAAHPHVAVRSGRYLSTAAGRYQFLSKTWDALAAHLGLNDFTPPNQDKAALELVRRAGAYKLVLQSDNYVNFSAAIKKINKIWASLPGSPYGQPRHPVSVLWENYRSNLAKY